MSEYHIRNAIVESVSLDDGDRGLLNGWLILDYGGSSQGFGGYALYLPKSYKNHRIDSCAGHFIWRCMEIAGVKSWDKIAGKAIRVALETPNGKVFGIGHITKDDWFFPHKDFQVKDAE